MRRWSWPGRVAEESTARKGKGRRAGPEGPSGREVVPHHLEERPARRPDRLAPDPPVRDPAEPGALGRDDLLLERREVVEEDPLAVRQGLVRGAPRRVRVEPLVAAIHV